MSGRGDVLYSSDDGVARPQGGPKVLPSNRRRATELPSNAPAGVSTRPALQDGLGVSGQLDGGSLSALTAPAVADPSVALGAQAQAGEAASRDDLARLSFFVRGQPQTQGSLRAMGKRLIDDNQFELGRWRGWIAEESERARNGRPPIARPVRVRLTFYVMEGRQKRQPWMLDPETGLHWLATTGRKDIDKLTRAVLDGMGKTGGRVYVDDGLVVELERVRSFFASPPDTPPGVLIEVWEL